MKKEFILITLFTMMFALFFTSCESDYLDKIEESEGYSEEDVFTDSLRFRDFCDDLVMVPTIRRFRDGNSPGGDFDDISDNSISGMIAPGNPSVQASIGDFYSMRTNGTATQANNGTWTRMWSNVRKANVCIEKIDMYTGSQSSKDGFLGQSYFFRALNYFELIRRWGGMPYITEPLAADSDMDLPRLSYQESMKLVAADFQMAADLLPPTVPVDRWQYPTSVGALAMKAKALIYAASPFAAEEPGSPGENLWEEAALAADAAIRHAESHGYGLVPLNQYKDLFMGRGTSIMDPTIFMKELLHGRNYSHAYLWNSFCLRYLIPSWRDAPAKSRAAQPNHLLVNDFEMQSTGLPITDPESGYEPQDPYAGRDPRLYENIIFNTQKMHNRGRAMQIWNVNEATGVLGSRDLTYTAGAINMGQTQTGYYIGKWVGTTLFKGAYYMQWSEIRMGSLYLIFAEAANEAWSNPAVKNGSCKYSAEEALNLVRNRVEMPDIHSKYLNKNDFRERVRNERRVELAFEGERLFDIRRWKVAHLPENRDIWQMYITKLPEATPEYPTGFKYEPRLLKTRVFEPKHYLFVINIDDTEIGPNFVQNPGW
jgi:starch-binding outer membrane protein, SusD/RagB family